MVKHICITDYRNYTVNKMIYRILFCAIAFLSSFACYADTTCKISKDGDTVEAQSAELVGDNAVVVVLGNDSNMIAANVSVTVEVDYGGNYKKQYTGKTQVHPMQSIDLKIPIESIYGQRSPKSVTVVSVTGSKCL